MKTAFFQAVVVLFVKAVPDGRAGTAARSAVVDFCENVIALHLVGEVAPVEGNAQNGFVEVLELRHREYSGQEVESDRFEMDVTPQMLGCNLKNLVVIEGEFRDFVQREPFRLVGVRVGLDLCQFYEGIMRDRDDAFPRIAVDVAEGADLLEVLDGELESVSSFSSLAAVWAMVLSLSTSMKPPGNAHSPTYAEVPASFSSPRLISKTFSSFPS